MSEPISLYWLADASCSQVAQDVSSLLEGFCHRWGLPAAGAVECTQESAEASLQRERSADLRATMPQDWRDAVARALFNHPATGSTILRGVLDRAEQDLQTSLNSKFGPQANSATPTEVPGHVGVSGRLEWLGLNFELRLSCAQLLAGGWLRRPARAGALARVSLESALAKINVPLVAQIGSTEVSVGDLLHLAPGDVLLLSESLEEPLRISSPGSALSLHALLGASPFHDSGARHRAVRWLTH